jgi:hypothetical protein
MAKLILSNTRLAFPAIFEAKAFGDAAPAFSASFILTPGHAGIAVANAAIEAAAKEKWGAKAEATLKQLRAAGKVCLHDGDEKASYDGFEGNLYVSARAQTRPLILDRDKSPLVQSDGKPYAGCFVVASLEVWAQDNQFGKRVNATLKGVQFYADGDAFSGSGTPADPDDFADLSAGADAEAALA